MTIDQQVYKALESKVPIRAAQYCWDLWKADPFHFIISRSRATKLGDFRYHINKPVQTITINHDLNPYQFLITYVHEVAHHRAFKTHGRAIKPHGWEWKTTFQKLMEPLLSDLVFPKDILIPLKRHLTNPKASSGTDLFLNREIRKYDPLSGNNESFTLLADLKPGAAFELKGRLFKKESTRRTRVLCLEVKTGRKYLIPATAQINLA
ncbi:SprT family zinc-dependent metalloprotease [Pararhodonellum marinum]|uniref:transcription elongation protein SprT n=1 Tax=Pararhodonellum marinum TaxID=2755358 RepID=UPI0018903951|nr:transcription elongation protein SprT [Pararhodonellum marinum]